MNMTVQVVKQGECEACLTVLALDTQEQQLRTNKQTAKKTYKGWIKMEPTVTKVYHVKQGKKILRLKFLILKIKLIAIYSGVIFFLIKPTKIPCST